MGLKTSILVFDNVDVSTSRHINIQHAQNLFSQYSESKNVMFLKNEVLVMKECSKQFFLEISTKSIFSIKSKKKKVFQKFRTFLESERSYHISWWRTHNGHCQVHRLSKARARGQQIMTALTAVSLPNLQVTNFPIQVQQGRGAGLRSICTEQLTSVIYYYFDNNNINNINNNK